jgi:large subunit ribosomal protein L24
MAHVKKGDTVLVIAGKDKGVKGTVLSVLRDVDKVLVEGVNRVKRHTKVTTGARGVAAGGIQIQEAPIHISNVKLLKDEKKKETKKASSKVKEDVSEDTVSETETKPVAKKAPAKKAVAKKAVAKKAPAEKAPAKKAVAKKAVAKKTPAKKATKSEKA